VSAIPSAQSIANIGFMVFQISRWDVTVDVALFKKNRSHSSRQGENSLRCAVAGTFPHALWDEADVGTRSCFDSQEVEPIAG
jgi:hypothetical protein